MSHSDSTDPIEQRQIKLQELQEAGVELYPHRYSVSHPVPELSRTFGPRSSEELDQEKPQVQVAGRVVSMRGHGKVGFAHLLGDGERIQIYVRKDRVGDKDYGIYQLLDIGDIIGVRGHMFRTRTGELTIFAAGIDFLAKSLLPLPEKWHGLADVELRYRQRYLDLIANPEVRQVFVRRGKIIRSLRHFLDEHGFLEVETPMMQSMAGGALARPFTTYHQALSMPLFLRIAPELYLKRLTVGGFDRVYEINKNFRNEGISKQHNPEFTMLEFYAAYLDYRDLMDFTEALLSRVVEESTGGLKVTFGAHEIGFDSYERLTMVEAIRRHWPLETPAPEGDLPSREEIVGWLGELETRFDPAQSAGKLLGTLFEEVAEKHLIQPTFIYDYPVELSPLSKRKADDPRFVERFELYVAGFEIANAYSELNDPAEQRQRFEEQLEARKQGDEEAHAMDEDYIRALRHGMPPAGGEGIGIDRLTMVLTNSQSIREVILFPLLRPE